MAIKKKENNAVYDLMVQLTQEQKSLWRIENSYQKEVGISKEIKEFWKALAEEKKALVSLLKELVKKELSK